MKFAYALVPLALLAFPGHTLAQGKIFRCGNTYTNDEAQARANACKLVEGGNVTVVQGTRVQGNAPAATPAPANGVKVANAPQAANAPGQRVDAGEQKARDDERRLILESELKRAEAKHAELLKEWNNGEPDKLGPETRNHQKYLDRVGELKAAVERSERDLAGLKRELGRTSGSAAR